MFFVAGGAIRGSSIRNRQGSPVEAVVVAVGIRRQQISEREKEIIAATFNQLKGRRESQSGRSRKTASILREVQAKAFATRRSRSRITATKARQLDGSGCADSSSLSRKMELAVAAMSAGIRKTQGTRVPGRDMTPSSSRHCCSICCALNRPSGRFRFRSAVAAEAVAEEAGAGR